MNTFVIQMQSALKQQLRTVANNITNIIANNIANNFATKNEATTGGNNNGSPANRLPSVSPRLHPELIARALQYIGMAITAMAITYSALQWCQLPAIPALVTSSIPSPSVASTATKSTNYTNGTNGTNNANNTNHTKSNPGVTLFTTQDITAAYDLFGSKPVMLDAIVLRGTVATGKNANGSLTGFALFELDGKPVNPIGIGESLGRGLSLQSIGDESATLIYQGQQIEFKLSKPTRPTNQKAITTKKM